LWVPPIYYVLGRPRNEVLNAFDDDGAAIAVGADVATTSGGQLPRGSSYARRASATTVVWRSSA
jgi:hypothetical protein